jgi:adenylate cyclase class 2
LHDTSNVETEVKFLVSDLKRVETAVIALGGTVAKPRVHEINQIYDDPGGSLTRRDHKLRLRVDRICRLTLKRPLPRSAGSEFKIREELEVEVSDFGIMEKMLAGLGYQPILIYEKYRTTMKVRGVELVLDEMPFGSFVELEGEESAIREVASALGFAWDRRVVENYMALFQKLGHKFQLGFRDLTFDNFERAVFSWEGLIAPAL